MDRKKIMYIGIILIVTVILSVTCFSYAFFTHTSEQRGKLNVVVGTLDYKLECEDLTNNSVTLAANERKMINVKITSLNDTNSKYELYYTTTNNNIIIGYSSDTQDNPVGTINANQAKTITVILRNITDSGVTVTFGVQGGFTSKTLTLAEGNNTVNNQLNNCAYEINYIWDYGYNGTTGTNGSIQTFTSPCQGNYKLEVWGAQGGTAGGTGGMGGYSTGQIELSTSTTLYIGVGGKGLSTTANTTIAGGYNGGGSSYNNGSNGRSSSSGGGATHIALDSGVLSSLSAHKTDGGILLVAGGGGGSYYDGSFSKGGAGGGTSGLKGENNSSFGQGWGEAGSGGTQTGGGYSVCNNSTCSKAGNNIAKQTFGVGSFGQGGYHSAQTNSGGGGGYYGGGASVHIQAGGGGSGYIGGVTNGQTIAGNVTITEPNGTSSTGHSGNGYARITYLGD